MRHLVFSSVAVLTLAPWTIAGGPDALAQRRCQMNREDVERASVPFPPTRVLAPGEPWPPAEVRMKRPRVPDLETRLREIERKLDLLIEEVRSLKAR